MPLADQRTGREVAVQPLGADPALRVYGAGLALVNMLTVLCWHAVGEQSYFDVRSVQRLLGQWACP